jgi:hypothetical protein
MKASQGLISGALLLAIRQTEAQRGQLLAHHGRHPAALRGTPPVRHKRNRQKSKARARWMGLFRFYRPESFHDGEYSLGI